MQNLYILGAPEITANLYCNFVCLYCVIFSKYLREHMDRRVVSQQVLKKQDRYILHLSHFLCQPILLSSRQIKKNTPVTDWPTENA